MGMGMFMAVGRGSDNPPRMIVHALRRRGREGRAADGIWRSSARASASIRAASSIKPADRMEEMKMDKTGACTVISAIATVAAACTGHAVARPGAGRREHARPALDATRRHRPRAERQDGRHHQHGRRGPADPRRRHDLRRAAGRHAPRGRRDADGRRRAGARPPGDRRVRHPAGLVRRGHGGRRRGPASATGSCRSSTSTGPRWTAGTPTSSTPARPKGRSIKSAIFLREFVTKPWVHLDIASTAYFRKAMPWAPRGRRASPTRRSWSSRWPGPPEHPPEPRA